MKQQTIKQNAQSFLLQSPHGFRHAGAEKAASRKSSPRGKDRKHEEDALQIAVCQYLDLFPQILYWATPNSTYIGKPTGAKLGYLAKQKRMGVKRGVSDLCLMLPRRGPDAHILFLELKVGKNDLTDEQTQFMQAAQYRGATCAVIRSLEDVKMILAKCEVMDKNL